MSSLQALDFQISEFPASTKALDFQSFQFPNVQPQGSGFENFRAQGSRFQISKFPAFGNFEIWNSRALGLGMDIFEISWKFGIGGFKTEQLWIMGGGRAHIYIYVYIYIYDKMGPPKFPSRGRRRAFKGPYTDLILPYRDPHRGLLRAHMDLMELYEDPNRGPLYRGP